MGFHGGLSWRGGRDATTEKAFDVAYCYDENMLVIRGDEQIADIYFGEFLRLYSHYAFRDANRELHETSRGHCA